MTGSLPLTMPTHCLAASDSSVGSSLYVRRSRTWLRPWPPTCDETEEKHRHKLRLVPSCQKPKRSPKRGFPTCSCMHVAHVARGRCHWSIQSFIRRTNLGQLHQAGANIAESRGAKHPSDLGRAASVVGYRKDVHGPCKASRQRPGQAIKGRAPREEHRATACRAPPQPVEARSGPPQRFLLVLIPQAASSLQSSRRPLDSTGHDAGKEKMRRARSTNE